DADATTNGVTYSLVDNAGGKFAIHATTGVVTVAGAIDREAVGASLDIVVRATSADGSTADKTFTIAINDVDDNPVVGPTDTDGATGGSVAENAANGTAVGITASASDADIGATISYSLTNN